MTQNQHIGIAILAKAEAVIEDVLQHKHRPTTALTYQRIQKTEAQRLADLSLSWLTPKRRKTPKDGAN
jgi:hypothetical protein